MVDFSRITKQIQTSLSLLENAEDNPYKNQTLQMKNKFESVEREILSMANSPNLDDSEQIRQRISSTRKLINGLVEQNDEYLSLAADDYRNKISSQKDQFETMTPSDQRTMNPTAFQSKQIFHTFEKLNEQLLQINEALMNWSGQVEHSKLETQTGPEIHSNPENQELSRPTLSP